MNGAESETQARKMDHIASGCFVFLCCIFCSTICPTGNDSNESELFCLNKCARYIEVK